MRFGQHPAIFAGINHAKGDAVVIMILMAKTQLVLFLK